MDVRSYEDRHDKKLKEYEGQTKGKITKKAQETRLNNLKWYGHVMKREEHYLGMSAMEMKLHRRRKRGIPKRRYILIN